MKSHLHYAPTQVLGYCLNILLSDTLSPMGVHAHSCTYNQRIETHQLLVN